MSTTQPHVAVLGAAGRVGRAVTTALLNRGNHVTAVVRDPAAHEFTVHPELLVAQGDAQHLDRLAALLSGVDALVLAVTPFTAPPESFDGFDLDYYADIVTGLDQHWRRPHRRLVAVGLTATLQLDSGGAVMDDPTLFPPRLTPFATAHERQLSALRNTTALDWAVLTPPAGFGTGPVERDYRLVTEPVTQRQASTALPHALYSDAVTAEIIAPTVHRARVLVVPGPEST